jgi:hypothetical protein
MSIEYLSYFDKMKIFIRNENENTDVSSKYSARDTRLVVIHTRLSMIKNTIKETVVIDR